MSAVLQMAGLALIAIVVLNAAYAFALLFRRWKFETQVQKASLSLLDQRVKAAGRFIHNQDFRIM